MPNLFSKLKLGALCVLIGTGLLSGPSWALTAAEITAARTAAQSEGADYGESLRSGVAATDPRTGAASTTTTLKPSEQINKAATTGADNIWGAQYTSTVPASLTDNETSSSMIAVGNAAKGASVSGFTTYNSTRSDQANQANYFLSQAPVVKPSISPTEPWLVGAQEAISSLPTATTPSTTTCTQPPIDTPASVSDNTCSESYVPYIVPCTSMGLGISFELVPAPVVAASISSYSCPASSGNTNIVLAGSMCTSTTTTTHSATTVYTCPTGATRSGTTCTLITTANIPANVNYSCPASSGNTVITLSGGTCTSATTTTNSATTNYTCPTGAVRSGTTCTLTTTANSSATVNYSCPASSGNTTVVLTGSNCASTTVTTSSATTNYTCPAGATRSGTTCSLTTTATSAATVNYSCALGETLSGTSCIKTTTSTQAPTTNYGCSAGQVLSGSNCVTTSTQTATQNYYCPVNTGILSGSTCVRTNTYAATATYSCSPGATLNGTNCNTVTPVLQTTCNLGQTYTINLNNMTGMNGDACQGGDGLWASWVCTGATNPTISMRTNARNDVMVGVNSVPQHDNTMNTVPVVSVDGYCHAGFAQSTICSNGTCNGTYVMAIGTMSTAKNYMGCNGRDYYNPDYDSCIHNCGRYAFNCVGSYPRGMPNAPAAFVETSFGSATRITATATFQTAATVNQTSTVAATRVYSCPSGGSLSGSTCTTTANTSASIAYTCPTGYSLSGTTCSKNTTTPATQTFTCNPGYTLSGSSCVRSTTSTTPATVGYSCPSGYSLSGTNCNRTTTVTSVAGISYSCPAGTVLNGSNCVSTVVTGTAASVSYSCPAGAVRSGTTCTTTTVATSVAGVSYSCPAGASLSGTTCTSTIVTGAAAAISYSCPPASGNTVYALSGSTCTRTTTATTLAGISYSCPVGEVLSGTTCTKTVVSTAAATTNYSCPTGFTLSGTQCTGKESDKLVETSGNGCGSLEGLSN